MDVRVRGINAKETFVEHFHSRVKEGVLLTVVLTKRRLKQIAVQEMLGQKRDLN